MSNKYVEIIDVLQVKIKKMITLYNESKTNVKLLKEKNTELENKLKSKGKEQIELENKFNSLKLAKSVLVASEDSHDARIKINRIVREIDNCIALLNR